MNDSLLDDVKALLDKEFGDDRILKQICRACENDEVISNYERNYVRNLAEKHLGRKPEFTPTPSVAEKPSIPDVSIPEIQSIQQTQSFQTEVPRISYSKSKNKKIKPIVFIGRKADKDIKAIYGEVAEIIEHSVFEKKRIYWYLNKIYRNFIF